MVEGRQAYEPHEDGIFLGSQHVTVRGDFNLSVVSAFDTLTSFDVCPAGSLRIDFKCDDETIPVIVVERPFSGLGKRIVGQEDFFAARDRIESDETLTPEIIAPGGMQLSLITTGARISTNGDGQTVIESEAPIYVFNPRRAGDFDSIRPSKDLRHEYYLASYIKRIFAYLAADYIRPNDALDLLRYLASTSPIEFHNAALRYVSDEACRLVESGRLSLYEKSEVRSFIRRLTPIVSSMSGARTLEQIFPRFRPDRFQRTT